MRWADGPRLRGLCRGRAVAGGGRGTRHRAGRRRHRRRGGRAPRRARAVLPLAPAARPPGRPARRHDSERLPAAELPRAARRRRARPPRPHAWHSPHTLATLLARSGWEVEGAAYYQNPAPGMEGVAGTLVRGARAAFVSVGRLAPYWSDGIVLWARPGRRSDRAELLGFQKRRHRRIVDLRGQRAGDVERARFSQTGSIQRGVEEKLRIPRLAAVASSSSTQRGAASTPCSTATAQRASSP